MWEIESVSLRWLSICWMCLSIVVFGGIFGDGLCLSRYTTWFEFLRLNLHMNCVCVWEDISTHAFGIHKLSFTCRYGYMNFIWIHIDSTAIPPNEYAELMIFTRNHNGCGDVEGTTQIDVPSVLQFFQSLHWRLEIAHVQCTHAIHIYIYCTDTCIAYNMIDTVHYIVVLLDTQILLFSGWVLWFISSVLVGHLCLCRELGSQHESLDILSKCVHMQTSSLGIVSILPISPHFEKFSYIHKVDGKLLAINFSLRISRDPEKSMEGWRNLQCPLPPRCQSRNPWNWHGNSSVPDSVETRTGEGTPLANWKVLRNHEKQKTMNMDTCCGLVAIWTSFESTSLWTLTIST